MENKTKQNPIASFHPSMTALLEALGLDSKLIKGFALVMRPDEVVTMSVEMMPTEGEIEKVVGVVKHYRLTVEEMAPKDYPNKRKTKEEQQFESLQNVMKNRGKEFSTKKPIVLKVNDGGHGVKSDNI